MSPMRSLLVTLTLTGIVACHDSDGATRPPDDTSRVVPGLSILGEGKMSARFMGEVWVRGTTGYTTTWGTRGEARGNVLHIWDVSGATPLLVDSVLIDTATTLGDVQASDDGSILVVATERQFGSIVIFDLANPRKPVLLSRFRSANTASGVHTAEVARVNGRLYAFLSIDPSPSQLVIVDLTNPRSPVEVLARPMGIPFIHDVFVRDGLLFTALWNDGTAIWDIGGGGRGGSVQNPVQIGKVRTASVGLSGLSSAHNVWWFHDPVSGSKRFAFVGEEGPGTIGNASEGDVHVIEVSDLTAPREVAFYHVDGAGTHNFSVDEARGVLYAAYYNGGVRALDIRGDLSVCAAAEKAADGRCDLGKMQRELARGLQGAGQSVFVWGVQFLGDAVYASDMLNGLWKLAAVTR